MSATVLMALYIDTQHDPYPLAAAPPSRPPAYAWLANSPEEGAVLEVSWIDNPWIVYNNLDHGRRMVHGQSYIRPYRVDELEELPALSPAHLALLWEHFHPRFIVVRAGLYPPEMRAEVMRAIRDQPRALRLHARFGDDHVYELLDRSTGAHLYRVWPREELVGRRGFTITARVTGGRSAWACGHPEWSDDAGPLGQRSHQSTAGSDVDRPRAALGWPEHTGPSGRLSLRRC